MAPLVVHNSSRDPLHSSIELNSRCSSTNICHLAHSCGTDVCTRQAQAISRSTEHLPAWSLFIHTSFTRRNRFRRVSVLQVVLTHGSSVSRHMHSLHNFGNTQARTHQIILKPSIQTVEWGLTRILVRLILVHRTAFPDSTDAAALRIRRWASTHPHALKSYRCNMCQCLLGWTASSPLSSRRARVCTAHRITPRTGICTTTRLRDDST